MRSVHRLLLLIIANVAAVLLARGAELTVFAAASVADALGELAPQFEAVTGHRVRANFGASGTLARQIREGAPADVFLSADAQRMQQLASAGLLLPATHRVLLANQLVVVVSADAAIPITGLPDLAKPAIRRVAIGEPATVPAGTYTKQHLENTGLWGPLRAKLVPVDNVRAVLAAVEAGNVDAGFVYRTDALVSRRVRIAIEVPLAAGPKIIYPVAVLKDSRSPDAARAFVAFLADAEAQAVFAKHGFLAPPAD